MGFQKQAFKVMLSVCLLLACFALINSVVEKEIRILKKSIYAGVIGPNYIDCLEAIRNEKTEIAENDPEIKKLQNKINLINIGSLIICFGLVYLFSCGIVRLLIKNQSKQQIPKADI